MILAFARSYLAQRLDLVESPARARAWSHRDPVVLNAQGAASKVVATLLADLGVTSRINRIRDIGTGVAGLAVAFCEIGSIHALLRPGGPIVVGVTFADEPGPLAAATDDLMTVRSGGSVLDPAGATARLMRAGFENVEELERTWNPPLRFVVGRRA